MNFPIALLTNVSSANPWSYVIFALIGFGFGFSLEMSGFGNSKKLAAQFYFTDLTVLKVMFTGIIVAMVLIFGSAGLGILDFNQVWQLSFRFNPAEIDDFFGFLHLYKP